MDLSPMINEFETSFLVDSSTESFNESPLAEEESEQSEDSTACDIDLNSATQSSSKKQLHLLDKDVSVDEDILMAPLEPIRQINISTVDNSAPEGRISNDEVEEATAKPLHFRIFQDDFLLASILRRESACAEALRRVSFPQDQAELATYREPESDPPWVISTYMPPEKLLQVYQTSCKQHQTIELDSIKNLILEIKNNTNHSAVLNLSAINITNEVNETIEDLLKVANFRSLSISECKFTSETISEFLNMLEYYESVREIEVAMNFDDIEAWKCFCNACTNIMILESISFKGMVINDSYMRILLNAIRNNPKITTLRFDACTLIKLPSFYLVENLMTNTTLCELYLPSTGLYTKEADCLGRFLQKNVTLRVLDISNNFIGDRGLEVLAKGLTKQNAAEGSGLSVLVIFNNQITEKCGPSINNIITECKNLHTLNIGYNSLTDEVISHISTSLEVTESLEGLGLQCTLLTCKGIEYLATGIENNKSLQKINLKGNKAIQLAGLERLCQALTNSKITKIEIDNTNRSSSDPQAYVQLVKKINAICTVNKSLGDPSCDEITKLISRKVSLSCEPQYIIPNVAVCTGQNEPSHVSSRPPTPGPKSRFQITKVEERTKQKAISRFKVSPVPPEEDIVPGNKFANARSSVSSNDSVDSLQLDTDSD